MKNKFLQYFILTVVLYLCGCDAVDRYHSEGLKDYFLQFVDSSKIKIVEVEDGMFPSSRQGYFLFTISSEEFIKLTQDLSLKQLKSKDDIIAVYKSYEQELNFIKWNIKNPNWNPNNKETWIDNSPILPEVFIYYADPSLPPMESNSQSSFVHLIYNTASKTCCVLLEYPYG